MRSLQIQQIVVENEGVGLLVDTASYRRASCSRIRRERSRVDALQGASAVEVQLSDVAVEPEEDAIIGGNAGRET
jgi:hypothetical protein